MLQFLTNALTTGAAPAETAQLVFDPFMFVSNLRYMGIGMVVIFIIIGVIILSTMLINYLFSE
jgi:hypothetical protein